MLHHLPQLLHLPLGAIHGIGTTGGVSAATKGGVSALPPPKDVSAGGVFGAASVRTVEGKDKWDWGAGGRAELKGGCQPRTTWQSVAYIDSQDV